jgi:sugar lactone lactonase YvrE
MRKWIVRVAAAGAGFLLLCPSARAQYQFERSIGRPPTVGEPIGLSVDRAGNIFVADRTNGKVARVTRQKQLSFPLGPKETVKRPGALAIGPRGELLVADESEGGVIRRYTRPTSGAKPVSTIQLAPEAAEPSGLSGVAVDRQGNVYATDQLQNTVRKFAPDGSPLKSWGKRGSASGEFQGPRGIAVDGAGNVYVADERNNRIQKFDGEGRLLGQSDARRLGATVSGGLGPMSVAVDSKGGIWVAAHTNFAVYKLDPEFNIAVRLETFGRRDGELAGPVSVAVDASDNVYVLDRSRRIQRFSPNGSFQWRFDFPPAKAGELSAPTGVHADAEGNVYVSDTANFRIQKFSSDGRHLLTFGQFGQADGDFNGAESIAIDRNQNLWIVDSYNHRVQKFTNQGKFLLKVGSFGRGNAEFIRTKVVATDNQRDWVYVNDWNNARVQKFDLNGGFLTSFGDAGPPATRIPGPTGLGVDAAGNVYVSSWFNNAIQKFDSSGKHLATIGGPGVGDGQFKGPARLTVTRDGRLVVADWGNNRVQVLDQNGRFLTKLGSFGRGDGQFDQPVGVSVDANGNLFVSDAGNSRVQKFVPTARTERMPEPRFPGEGRSEKRRIFAHIAIYDLRPNMGPAFEAALAATATAMQGEPGFINERALRNIDGLTLQYATYSRFKEQAAAERAGQGRIREHLERFCRRPPETHILVQTDAYSPEAVSSAPSGREYGHGMKGQIAHLGLFIPIPQYVGQYFDVLRETKVLTRQRRPEGYLGEDLLVELASPPPEQQSPYSPRAPEPSPMSVNYGEYRSLKNAEDSYISRQVIRDQKLVTMERTFFSSLQVPTRFYIFEVIGNVDAAAQAVLTR